MKMLTVYLDQRRFNIVELKRTPWMTPFLGVQGRESNPGPLYNSQALYLLDHAWINLQLSWRARTTTKRWWNAALPSATIWTSQSRHPTAGWTGWTMAAVISAVGTGMLENLPLLQCFKSGSELDPCIVSYPYLDPRINYELQEKWMWRNFMFCMCWMDSSKSWRLLM